jgi:hypothetical protein
MPSYAPVGQKDEGLAAEWPVTEQEERLGELFARVNKLLKKAEKIKDPDKLHKVMMDITPKLREAKT